MITVTDLGPAIINAAREDEELVVFPQKDDLNELAYTYGPLRTQAQRNASDNQHQMGPDTREMGDLAGTSLEVHTADWLGFNAHEMTLVFPSAPPIEDGDIAGVFEIKRATKPDSRLVYRTVENRNHIIIQGMVENDGTDLGGNIILLGWNYPVYDEKYAKFAGYDNAGRRLSYIPIYRRRPMRDLVALMGGVAA